MLSLAMPVVADLVICHHKSQNNVANISPAFCGPGISAQAAGGYALAPLAHRTLSYPGVGRLVVGPFRWIRGAVPQISVVAMHAKILSSTHVTSLDHPPSHIS